MSYIHQFPTGVDGVGRPLNIEQTLVLIKPEAVVSQQVVGQIVSTFEQKGLRILAMSMDVRSADLIRTHYSDLAGKPHKFDPLIQYMTSGPVIAMVLEGVDAIRLCRLLINPTKVLEDSIPGAPPPGSIRGNHSMSPLYNTVHGSDSRAAAAREIPLWFQSLAVPNWTPATRAPQPGSAGYPIAPQITGAFYTYPYVGPYTTEASSSNYPSAGYRYQG